MCAFWAAECERRIRKVCVILALKFESQRVASLESQFVNCTEQCL